jgi:hypothetical protein
MEANSKKSYLETKKQKNTDKIQDTYEEFKKILNDKTLPENQSLAQKEHVTKIITRMLIDAEELDNTDPGNGIFSLIAVSLKSVLKVKDQCSKLESELREVKAELRRLKKT